MHNRFRAAALALICIVAACDSQNGLFSPLPQNSVVAPVCYGKSATIYAGNPGAGTIVDDGSGNLTITGTAGNDVIVSGTGNDVISGLGGNDRICAGDGNDAISTGAGTTDWADGEAGVDVIDYSTSPNGVNLNLNRIGQSGGDAENDRLANIESVIGSAFADVLIGTVGANALSGGDGDDEIWPGGGADVVDGGAGSDLVSYADMASGVTVDLGAGTGSDGATYSAIENVDGSSSNDVLKGDGAVNVLRGRGGDDQVWGGAQNDQLAGGAGADQLHGEDGEDRLLGGDGTDKLYGEAGNDSLWGDGDDDELYGGDDDDYLRPGEGTNTVDGGAGTDKVGTISCVDVITNVEVFDTYACGARADETTTLIDVADVSLLADGTSTTTITVHVKNQNGDDHLVGGVWVYLATSAGLLDDGTSQASEMRALDNGDGSYSLTLIASSTVETATITGGVDGRPITDNATVDFTATSPIAVSDANAGTSGPGDPYHTAFNTMLTIATAAPQNLLANDNLGAPSAKITSFGAIQTNDGAGTLNLAVGTVTTNAAGATATVGADGSLTVNEDGSLTYVPPTDYTGLLRFEYRIGNAGGTSDAQVTLAAGVRPSASNSTYGTTLLGNVPINTANSTNTLVNGSGDALAFNITGGTGGTGAIATGKTYSFTPSAGFTGAASFTFTAKNGFGTTATATLSLTVGTPVWFVDASAGGGGTGTKAAPFNCLVGGSCYNGSANLTAHVIYVASGTYSDNAALVLKDNQKLLGQASTSDFATASGLAWPADAGAQPATSGAAVNISTSSGNVITLASGNTLRGLALGNAGSGGTTLSGTSFGTLTVANDVGIGTNTQAISLSTGTISGNFAGVTSAGGTDNISLTSVSGTVDFGGGALSGATTNAFLADGGGGSFTYSGSISGAARPANIVNKNGGGVTLSGSINASGNGILVQSNSAGSYTFSNATKTLSTGANDAVKLASNTGATIAFTGGNLALTTSTGTAFTAIGGGTVTVEGSNNTVSLTGNVLNGGFLLDGITVGTNDISFASINSSATTTASPIFTNNVTGSATQTINLGTITIAGTNNPAINSPPGIYLISTSAPVNVTSATIDNTEDAGIFVQNSSGAMTFSSVDIDGNGQAGIQLTGNTGVVSVNGGAIGAGNDPTGNVVDVDGGDASITIAAALTKNTAGRIAEVTNHTAGTVDFTNPLNCTSVCTGINVASNTGGTIQFTSGTKTLNTGGSNAVTLSGNSSGVTIALAGGGLDIMTVAGKGLAGTGSGILNITGANNTINTTGTGAAFELVGTSGTHFGAGSITFETINKSGGGSKGVVVNYYDGSFMISGDDNNDNIPDGLTSGGSITGTTGRGIEIIDVDGAVVLGGITLTNATTSQTVSGSACGLNLNTNNNTGCNAPIYLESTSGGVTLRKILVDGSVQGGINGFAVTNLVMSDIEVRNVGDEVGENGILMKNLTGSGSAANLNLHDNEAKQLHIINTSGILTAFPITGTNSFKTSPAPNGGQGILLEAFNSGTSITMSVTGAVFQDLFTNAVQVAANSGSTINPTIQNSTFTNVNSWAVIQASDGGTTNYTVSGNNGTAGVLSGSTAINIKTDNADLAGAPSNSSGTISGNTIGGAAAGSGAACGGACSGIAVNQEYGGTLTANVINNTIRHVDANGIFMSAGNSYAGNAGKLIVTITGNLIKDPDGGVLEAIQIRAGKSSGDVACVQATVGGLTNPGAWPSATANAMNRIEGNWDFTGSPTFSAGGEIFLWRRFTTNFMVPGYVAPTGTFLSARNSITSADGTNAYSSGTITAGNCP